MAKKKGTGKVKTGRDSESKRLGVKLFAGQITQPGNIIIRQRGTKFLPGENVALGKDYTIYALKKGKVQFKTIRKTTFSGKKVWKKIVNVLPLNKS